MAEFTMLRNLKAEQCRQNAQAKSDRKRQDVLEAISLLQQQQVPVTKSSVAKQAGVSYPFLSKHADLLQAIENAGSLDRDQRLSRAVEHAGKDQVIAALQRRLDKLQQQVHEKEAEIQQQKREIAQLYGKLASRK